MFKKYNTANKSLLILLLIYCAASLIHFIHNAEYLSDYPNLPDSWTRPGVYYAWLGLTIIGISGWLLLLRGHSTIGLLILAIYAALGLDSLGHYVVAPISAHSIAMNLTILLEVAAAAFVLIEVIRLMAQQLLQRGYSKHDA